MHPQITFRGSDIFRPVAFVKFLFTVCHHTLLRVCDTNSRTQVSLMGVGESGLRYPDFSPLYVFICLLRCLAVHEVNLYC